MAHPKLNSVKDWKTRFLYLSIPIDYPAPRHFIRPRPHNTYERSTTREERRVKDHFESWKEGKKLFPMLWVPPMNYILRDKVLSACSLSIALSIDKILLLVFGVIFSLVIIVVFLLILFFMFHFLCFPVI